MKPTKKRHSRAEAAAKASAKDNLRRQKQAAKLLPLIYSHHNALPLGKRIKWAWLCVLGRLPNTPIKQGDNGD